MSGLGGLSSVSQGGPPSNVRSNGIKGDVGKTSAAVNLAALAAAAGRRTLLWDLDPQGAAGYLLRVKPKVKGGSIGLLTGRRDLDDAVRSTSVEGLDLLPADVTIRAADAALEDAKKPGRQLGRLLKTVREHYGRQRRRADGGDPSAGRGERPLQPRRAGVPGPVGRAGGPAGVGLASSVHG
jgi:hypothetical protein